MLQQLQQALANQEKESKQRKEIFKLSKEFEFTSNYKFNRKAIMQFAWRLVREVGITLKQALLKAWEFAKSSMALIKVNTPAELKRKYFKGNYVDYPAGCAEIDRQNNWSLD